MTNDAAQIGELNLPLVDDADVAVARQRLRALAHDQRLSRPETEALATAVSEIARNVLVHAGRGELVLRPLARHGRRGVMAVARDNGPGVANTALAMQDGYTTGKGLGLGLPGARRLVDEFELRSAVGQGTTVTLIKWAAT